MKFFAFTYRIQKIFLSIKLNVNNIAKYVKLQERERKKQVNTVSAKVKKEERGLYPEVIGIILSAIGAALLWTSPDNLVKQTMCALIGLAGFGILTPMMQTRKITPAIRVIAGVMGLALLAANVLIGDAENGAQNWLTIKGWRFQPSELVKVCLVILAAGLKKDSSKIRFFVFTAFSAIAVLAMALINDFGSALIFFLAYLAAAIDNKKYSIAGLALIGAGGAGTAAVKLKPHIASRFLSCGKAWENAATTGYQQTRTMVAIASGGLFGVGIGKGWLRNVIAADTDMVFGIVCEELGLIVGVVMITLILYLGIAVLLRPSGSGAVAAAVILMTQMALNVLGSVDVVPFTGVTFPFVSRGGTSVLACWGLLAVIDGDKNA